MAEKDEKKKAAPAATRRGAAAKAKPATAAKAPTAAKAGGAAKAERAPRAEKPKQTAPTRRAVARPATRVVRREEPERPREEKAEVREKVAPHPLPTAPAGHAPLIAADGTASGSVELPAALSDVGKRKGVLFQALLATLANARQATAATKSRSRVAGGGAKPWRQKGTGRARQGTTRAPQWRHGGVVFGPNGRRYAQRMPEKMRRAAFAQAFASHAANGRVLVLEELRFDGDQPRTREVADWLAKVGDTGRAVLVTAEPDERVSRAAANLGSLDLRTPGTLLLTDVLRAETLLVQRPALEALAARATVGEA